MELRNHKTRWISKCTRWEKKYMGSLQRELQCFRLDKYTLCCSHFSPQQACEVAVESTMLSPFGKSYISFCQGRSSLKAILYQEILALIPKLSSPPPSPTHLVPLTFPWQPRFVRGGPCPGMRPAGAPGERPRPNPLCWGSLQ